MINCVGYKPFFSGTSSLNYAQPVWGGGNTLVNSGNSSSQKFPTTTATQIKTTELSKKQKQLIYGGVGILALGGIIATAILTKGKKIKLTSAQEAKLQELIANREINPKYVDLFKEIQHLDGDAFIKTAYKKIADGMGYGGFAVKPSLIIKNKTGNVLGIEDPFEIMITRGRSKADTLDIIRHELQHFKQNEMIYRAFGEQTYIEARTQRIIAHLKVNNEYCKSIFNGKTFDQLTETEINAFLKKSQKEIGTARLALFKDSAGTIKPGTPEYAKAQEYLEAARNYKTPTMLPKDWKDNFNNLSPEQKAMFVQYWKEYKNNILEIEAHAYGERIKAMFEKFTDAIKVA